MMQTAPAPGSLSQAFKSAAPSAMRPQQGPPPQSGGLGQMPQMIGGTRPAGPFQGQPGPGVPVAQGPRPGGGGGPPPMRMMSGASVTTGVPPSVQQQQQGGIQQRPPSGPQNVMRPGQGPSPPQQAAMAGQRMVEGGGTGGSVFTGPPGGGPPRQGPPPGFQQQGPPPGFQQQGPPMGMMMGGGPGQGMRMMQPPMKLPSSQQMQGAGPLPPTPATAIKGGTGPQGFQQQQGPQQQGPQQQGPPQQGAGGGLTQQGIPPNAYKGPLGGGGGGTTTGQQFLPPMMKGAALPVLPPTPTAASFRAKRRQRGRVEGETPDEEIEEDISPKGGLATFKNMVVLNDNGELGIWSGFAWKSRRVNGYNLTKVIFDKEGRLWCITDEWEVGTIADGIFKCLGHLGNEFVVDIAFHPVDGVLWAVNRLGELLRWGGFALERQQQIGFHKLKAIAFDKKGNLWALNTASELAVWNEELREWDIKDVPGGVRIAAMAFDAKNKLWVTGPEGQLLVLAGAKWVNYGFVGCWKVNDLAFKPLQESPEQQALDA